MHHLANRIFVTVFLAFSAICVTGCQCISEKPKATESTPWLPRHEFQGYLAQKEKKTESGKNFWDQGYSVGKLESRWRNGYQEYRIEIVENPKDAAFSWMWYFDMDKAMFQKKLSELSVQGYQLVSYSHNSTPAGGDSFGAIWNKKRTKER